MASNQVKCILLTLRTENVVVPNAAVAEIVSLREIHKIENAPKWLMGKMTWRGIEIPLVSFEAAAEVAGAGMGATQAAVLYLINKDDNLAYPYVGLAISGVPHVSHFGRDQINADTRVTRSHPMVAQRIRINGAAASILDIDAIGTMITQSGA
ncbi:MAG: chemotaxis protein CheW [Gammaproteobacteria bacterium]